MDIKQGGPQGKIAFSSVSFQVLPKVFSMPSKSVKVREKTKLYLYAPALRKTRYVFGLQLPEILDALYLFECALVYKRLDTDLANTPQREANGVNFYWTLKHNRPFP